MVKEHLDPPVFEIDHASQSVDPSQTPWFFNDSGFPVYLAEPPSGVTPIDAAPTDPRLAMGREVIVSGVSAVKDCQPYGIETRLDLVAETVVFEPLWATRMIAAAFGITLVEPGQAVRLESPVNDLAQVEYEYGVWAGHWSPYQNTGNRLLSVVCTDLEHHDFPHVFASTDARVPLVISVGRYWPALGRLRLADLWVPQGSALYIPPKPALPDLECLDLHNNRNSARACWGNIEHDTILTHTLLQPTGGFFHWYWNARDTAHSRPL